MRLQTLATLNRARADREVAVLVTGIDDGSERLVVGAPAADDPLAEAILRQQRQGKSVLVGEEGARHFLNVHVPPVKLVIAGAVHISQALAPMAALLGLETVVVDPRTAFATPERFPGVRLVAEWPDVALPPLGLDRYTAFVALTHDPKIDDPALSLALAQDCFYVGALGSRKTHAKRLERLKEAGFDDTALARIRSPIGLDIGAVSPAEIAVSILAEITAALRLESGQKQARAS